MSEIIPLKGLRGAISRSMKTSWQSPRVAMSVDVDVSVAQNYAKSQTAELGQKITLTHLLMNAVALSLTEYPQLNGTVTDEAVQLEENINLGIAVATANGLLVPVILQTEQLTLVEISRQLQDMAQKAQDNKLPASAYQKGTFTISSLGSSGVDWFTPILNPPQIAILGVGTVKKKAVVKNDEIVIAPIMNLTLVFDHRALDGMPAGEFLSALKNRVEQVDLVAVV